MSAAYPKVISIRGGQSPKSLSGPLSAPVSVQPVFDVYGFSAAFPDRWMGYLRAHFRNAVHVAHVFGVSERAARKWWDGDGACGGAKVVIALRLHPEASAMLLAA